MTDHPPTDDDDAPVDPVPPGPRYRGGTHVAAYVTLVAGLGLAFMLVSQLQIPRKLPDDFICSAVATALILGLSCCLFAVIRRDDLKEERRNAGLCPRCGYDCRATLGQCPECGSRE